MFLSIDKNNRRNNNLQQSANDSHRYGLLEIYDFELPSLENWFPPEENLEPNSAGLKGSRTRGVWHKSLEENHSAQIKEIWLLGHIMCSEEAQKKILESDIFRILESDGVIEIGVLHKVSP